MGRTDNFGRRNACFGLLSNALSACLYCSIVNTVVADELVIGEEEMQANESLRCEVSTRGKEEIEHLSLEITRTHRVTTLRRKACASKDQDH